jgi:hypothetical protein
MTDVRHLDLRFDTVHYKALAKGEPTGTFEAIGALFGNVDRHKERLQQGSLEESISKSLPAVVWSHDWLTPPVGVTIEMAELDRAGVERLSGKALPETVTGGLYGKGRLFIDPDEGDVPLARHIYTAMSTKGGDGQPALKEWSVGLNVKRESYEEIDGSLIVNLEKCDLPEWGPCLKGINAETFTVGTKADDIRRLITKGVLDPNEIRLALDLEPANSGDSDLKSALPDRRGLAELLFT